MLTADAPVVDALRAGDEAAFARLVDDLSPRMLRLARANGGSDATAEDIVQDAWIAVLRGIDRFEGRSALSTWIFGIVINVARARGRGEARSVPIPPERFQGPDAEWPGHWAIAPVPWPDAALETAESLRVLYAAVAALPDRQREVITLRDVVGASAEEVRNALGLTDTNQRVLLHRARTSVRAALEAAFGATERIA